MYQQLILKYLHTNGIISDALYNKIKEHLASKLFSVHYELRLLLYLGVTMLSSGLGILIYKNYQAIGHNIIIMAVAAVSFSCLGYCMYKKKSFSTQHLLSPGIIFDYVALLGCLTFATLSGYLQFQYKIFGEHFGLMALVPCCVFFVCAYLFDHKGILSIAIAALYAWAGLSITPREIISEASQSPTLFIYTGIVLGLAMAAASMASKKYDFKKHFEFTYANFALHTLFISTLSGLFNESFKVFYFLGLMVCMFGAIVHAINEKSFYFFMCSIVYGYIGISYGFITLLNQMNFFDPIFYFAYFIFSGWAVMRLLKDFRTKYKINDAVQ